MKSEAGVMKQFLKKRWVQLVLMTTTLFFGSVPVLMGQTTTDLDDIVDGLSKLDAKGENFTTPCTTNASNLDKRPTLEYNKDTGRLHIELSDKENSSDKAN
jgi:hypothetical protein